MTKRKEEKQMNKLKKSFAGILALLSLLTTLCGCSSIDRFWNADNEIPIVVQFNFIDGGKDAETVLDQEHKELGEAPEQIYVILKEEKNIITKYFSEKYEVDVSTKINSLQKVYLYSQDEYNGETLQGYVSGEDNTVHLNESTLDNLVLVRSVIRHELMHYLGVKPIEDDSCHLLVEGFADAIAQDIAEYEGVVHLRSLAYQMQYMLARQILVVDKDIVKKFLTEDNFDVKEYINGILADVPQTDDFVSDVAEHLETCISSYSYGLEGDEKVLVEVQAEYIVIAYCKTFVPSQEQIEEIRDYYLVDNIEEIEFVN